MRVANHPPSVGPSTLGPSSSQLGPTRPVFHQTTISVHTANSGGYNAQERTRPTKKIAMEKGKKRCALCALAQCKSADTCPGSGGRMRCSHRTEPAHAAGTNKRRNTGKTGWANRPPQPPNCRPWPPNSTAADRTNCRPSSRVSQTAAHQPHGQTAAQHTSDVFFGVMMSG
ncbi:hypothetical protein C8F01DRAFT_1086388 [Mycena amicta]|nr:hypothetical protein C8F01DRAFT_1086388 [Mycena amicta]